MPRVIVEGKPVPKARPRPNPRGGVFSPSKKDQTWVAYHFLPYRGRHPSGDVFVYAVFYVNKRSRADGDNLFKLVADAMEEAGVVTNDIQIRRHMVDVITVPYGQERTVVWFGTQQEAQNER